MYITRIALKRYSPFSFNGVKYFDMNTSANNTQIIVGTNGCGKSSLLREINPLPSVRTSFKKHGSSVIELTHDGSEYTLTSDFTNAHAPHSFLKDGQELNESGTTKVQQELVDFHLGYTQDIHKLLAEGIEFAELKPSNRKTLLLSINPFNLGLMDDMYRKIYKKIREIQSNLKRLNTRKIQLEDQMLNSSIYNELMSEKTDLDSEIEILSAWIIDITVHLNTLETLRAQDNAVYDIDLSSIKNLSATSLAHHKDDLLTDEEVISLENKSIEAQSEIRNLETNCQTLSHECDKYFRELSSLEQLQGTADELEREITTLREELESNKKYIDLAPVSQDLLYRENELVTELNNILDVFNSTSVSQILSLEKFEKCERHVMHMTRICGNLMSHRDGLLPQLEALQAKLRNPFQFPTDCKRSNCQLRNNSVGQRQELQTQHDVLDTEYKRLDTKVKRYEKAGNKFSNFMSQHIRYRDSLKKLTTLFQNHGELTRAIANMDIQESLKNNPSIIFDRVVDLLYGSKVHYKCKQDQCKLTELEKKYNTYASNTKSADFLKKELDVKETTLSSNRKKISELTVQYGQYQATLNGHTAKQKFIDFMKDMSTKLDAKIKQTKLDECIEYYRAVLNALNTVSNKNRSRLVEINKSLDETNSIKNRYQLEVVDVIKELEADLSDAQLIEKTLSFNTGLPHKYLTSFCNRLIDNMNYFISEVFSYPFELLPVSTDEALKYKFKAHVGTVEIGDISLCSSAQREMINIAFILAVMVQLKLSEYPLLLDECGKTFDEHHKYKLLEFLKHIVDTGIVKQLFIVNHDAILHEGFTDCDLLVLNDTNVMVPQRYNEHVIMKK